jgi:hypothetical protein
MKKFIIVSAIMLGGLGIKNADAQFGIRIHLNLGTRPVYAPAPQPGVVDDQPVYNDDDYYYLPDVEAYYSVGANCYYYQDGDRWISAAYLPGRYHDFDWRSARRYEIHANRPFMHHDVYRGKFGGYTNRNDYYARAYPNRVGFNDNRGRDQYDNRGWNNQNRGDYNRQDDRNHGGYNQQPGRDQNQGGYNQQNPSRGQQGQGGYNQGGQQQPSQGQQGGRGNDQPSRGQGGQNQGGGNNSQPANHNGNDGRGNYGGGQHFTANKVGVVNDKGNFGRPDRF